MVELDSRRKLAQLLRQVATGQCDSAKLLDFDRHVARLTGIERDPALKAILTWALMNEFAVQGSLRAARREGKRQLHPSQKARRRELARVILFLHSTVPYEWNRKPLYPQIGFHWWTPCAVVALAIVSAFIVNGLLLLLSVMAAVGGAVVWCRRVGRYNALPEVKRLNHAQRELWPFMHERDFVEALSRPRLLAGTYKLDSNRV